MAPPAFADFSKSVDDLFSNDFGSKKVVKSKFTSEPVLASPITFTSETTASDKLVGKFSAKWKHAQSGVSIDKATLDPKSGIGSLEATLSKLVSGHDVLVKCKSEPGKQTGEIETTYSTDAVYTGLLVKGDKEQYCKSAEVDATVSYDGLQVGCKLPLTTSKVLFDALSLGIGYGKANYFGAVSTVGNDLNSPVFKISGLFKATSNLTLACQAETTKYAPTEIKAASILAKFNISPECSAKTKVNKEGQVDAMVCYRALPKVMMTSSIGVGLGDSIDYKGFGASLTLG